MNLTCVKVCASTFAAGPASRLCRPCLVASVISSGWGGPTPQVCSFPGLASPGGGPTHTPEWVLQAAAGVVPSSPSPRAPPMTSFPSGWLGNLRPAQESEDLASPRRQWKELERNVKRRELRKQLLCSRFPAGSVQGVQRKLPIVPTHWHCIPMKNAATSLSNNGNVLELFLP